MAKERFKIFMERTTPFGVLARFQRQRQLKKKYRLWEKNGATGSMPNYGKQQVVIDYIQKFLPAVFIETGTYKGKMVYAVQPYIKEIYSIELSEAYCNKAQQRFSGYSNIHILHGQSNQVLPKILEEIDKPCLFWLDAHYSGGSTAKGDVETPIMQEMQCILNHPKAEEHIILIDDTRCFTGENDYPTVESFNSKLRDELLNRELFLHIDELRYVADCWRMDYNHYRLHSSLDYMAPAAFTGVCLEQGSATLRLSQDMENMCDILTQ